MVNNAKANALAQDYCHVLPLPAIRRYTGCLSAPISRSSAAGPELSRGFRRVALPVNRQVSGGDSTIFSYDIGMTRLVALAT